MTIKELISEITDEVDIQCARAFWDKDARGNPPEEYFVWKISGYNDRVESDNSNEVVENTVSISLFSKKEDFDARAEKIIISAQKPGCKAYMLSFEDYEKETKYHHKEIEIIIRR